MNPRIHWPLIISTEKQQLKKHKCKQKITLNRRESPSPFTFTYPLTVKITRAPQMTSQPVSSILHFPLGHGKLQTCPFPDVVLPPLLPSTWSFSPFHCALHDGFGQTWWTGNMTIPLEFASLYDRQEVFVWSNCLLDLGTDFLVGNMVFVWDA